MKTHEAIKYILSTTCIGKSNLARSLGVTPQAINNYLHRKSGAKRSVARKIEEKFKIVVTDIKINDVELLPIEIKRLGEKLK